MSEQDDINHALENAERFQRLFVQPMIEAVRAEMKTHLLPLQSKQAEHEKRLHEVEDATRTLQSNQTKALVGWGVLSLGIAAGISACWNIIKPYIGFSR